MKKLKISHVELNVVMFPRQHIVNTLLKNGAPIEVKKIRRFTDYEDEDVKVIGVLHSWDDKESGDLVFAWEEREELK